jgi:(p)ppGpp synthase/HD superfamily hydrolase
MMDESKIQSARAFAAQAHGDQQYGTEPYLVHLDEVANILCGLNPDDRLRTPALMAAYLHDVLEDTETTAGQIRCLFGDVVAVAVAFATDEPGSNRRLKKRATYARAIRQLVEWEGQEGYFPPGHPDGIEIGILVKVADRIANLTRSQGSDMMQMYRKEAETFRLAYYSEGVCDSLWEMYENLLRRTSK